MLLAFAGAPDAGANDGLDTSFGTKGLVTVGLGGGWTPFSGDVFRMADDRLVTAGSEAGYGLAFTRHKVDGSLDTTFSGDGIATFSLAGVDGLNPGFGLQVGGVVVDGAGAIYAVFTVGPTEVGVAKVTADGNLDPAFDGNGIRVLPTISNGLAGGIRLVSNRILAAFSDDTRLSVAALDATNGATDFTYGSGGVASVDAGQTVFAHDLVNLSTGTYVTGSRFDGVSGTEMMVIRITPDGTPVATYGGGGGFARPFSGTSAANSDGYELFAYSDGAGALVAGAADGGKSTAVAKLDPNGGLVPGFSGDGRLTDFDPGVTNARWDGISVKGDGSFAVAGGRTTGGVPQLLMRKYTATGEIDRAYGLDGEVILPNRYPAVGFAGQSTRDVAMGYQDDGGGKAVMVLAAADVPTGPTPPPTPPPEVVQPGCSTSISLGPLYIASPCLKPVGLTWEATGTVVVGGLSFVTVGSASKIIIDPLNARISAKGTVEVQIQGSYGNLSVGPITVYKGAFDWTFQHKPALRGLARLVQASSGDEITMADIERLPGLAQAGKLPFLPDLGGMRDFSKVTARNVAQFAAKYPTVAAASVVLPLSALGINVLPPLKFAVPTTDGKLFGFPLAGELTFQLGIREGVRGAVLEGNLALPGAFKGLTGTTKMFLGTDKRVRVEALSVEAAELWLPGLIRAAPVKLTFDGATNVWEGDTKVYLGFQPDFGLGGGFRVENGRLKRIAIHAGGFPLGIGTFDDITADLTLDPIKVAGSARFTLGPTLPLVGGKIVQVDGGFSFDGDKAAINGGLTVAKIPLANAKAEYWWNGYFNVEGNVSYYLDMAQKYGFRGRVFGEASSRGFNAEGSVQFLADSLRFGGSGLLSSKGVAACAAVQGPFFVNVQLGAGYKWGAKKIDWLGAGCDFAPFRAKIGAPAARAAIRAAGDAAPLKVTVAGGQKAVSFRVAGDGGAPRFTLTGPGGVSVPVAADGTASQTDRYVVIPQSADNTTYVAVGKPPAGEWTITPAEGSPAITGVSSAGTLPKPKVTARVRGRKLTYTVRAIPGQRVTFVEQGKKVSGVLGVAKGSRGSITFTPANGAGGTRTVVADIEQDGQLRARTVVARYTAPRTGLRAPRVAVRRGSSGLAVSWTMVPGATAYRVSARFNGRLAIRTMPARSRRTAFTGLLTSSGAQVGVQPVGGATRLGAIGRRTLATPKTKKRTGKAPKPAKKKTPTKKG